MTRHQTPDRYQIVRPLGQGSSASVWLVRDRQQPGAVVALKRLPLTDRALAVDEFRLLSELRHPNLAQVHDFGTDADGVYLTTDYCEGRLFSEITAVELHETRDALLPQLLDVLCYLHLRGVRHGDLKPQNLVLLPNGLLKVLDFGLANLTLRDDGRVAGSPAFLPPEAFDGARPDPAWDFYALGVTILTLATGGVPFGESLAEMLPRKRAPLPLTGDPLLDGAGAMVAPDPDQRPNTVGELRALLDVPRVNSAWPLARSRQIHGQQRLLNALSGRCGAESVASLLRGGSGFGKSRLLDTLRVHALIKGYRVQTIRARPDGEPLSAFAPLCRSLGLTPLRQLEGAAVHDGGRGELSAVNRQDGESAQRHEPSESEKAVWSGVERSADSRRQQLVFSLVEQLLGSCTEPTLWLLDDLHCMDPLSQAVSEALIRRVAHRETAPPIVIVGSAGVAADFWRAAESWPALVFDVGPLSPPECAAFLAETLGIPEIPSALSQRSLELTGGVPLALEAITLELVAAGLDLETSVQSRAGWIAAFSPDRLTTPAAIGDLLARAIDSLSPAAQTALALLATARTPLDRTFISALLGTRTWSEVETSGLARECNDSATGQLTLRHHALAEHLLDGLGINVRTTAARLLTNAAEANTHGSEQLSAALLADLHQQLANGEHELKYRLLAAEAALSLSDLDAATRHYERALTIHPPLIHERLDRLVQLATLRAKSDALRDLASRCAATLGIAVSTFRERLLSGKSPDLALDAALLLAIARADFADGDLETVTRNCGAIADALPMPAARDFRLLQIRALIELGRLDQAQPLAGALSRDHHDTQALLYLGTIAFNRNDLESASRAWEAARTQLGTQREAYELTRTMYNLAVLYYQQGRQHACTEILSEGGRLAAKGPFVRYQVLLGNMAGVVYQTLSGDYGRAQGEYARALRRAKELNDARLIVESARNVAHLDAILGRFEHGRRALDDALVVAQRSGSAWYEGMLRGIYGVLELAAFELAQAERQLRLAAQLQESSGDVHDAQLIEAMWSRWFRLQGDLDGGIAWAERALAQRGEDADADSEVELRLNLGQMLLSQGRLDEAVAVLSLLEQEGSAFEHQEYGWEIAFVLGKLHDALGTPIAAHDHWQRALAVLQRLARDLPPALKQSYRHGAGERADAWDQLLARLDAATGKSLDHQALEQLLAMTQQLNSELELGPLLDRVIDSVIALLGAERGFLLLKNEDGELRVSVARGLDHTELHGDQQRLSLSIAEEVARDGNPVITIDAQDDSRFDTTRSVHLLALHSIIAFPLRLRGEIIGTLYLDHRERVGAFTPEILPLAQAFADGAAIAIGNARLLGRLRGAEAKLREENVYLRREIEGTFDVEGIVGSSPRLAEVLDVVKRVAGVPSAVLIRGETGTGKELVARAIHNLSERSRQSLIKVNCAALTETLLESELFGHERGAFTGATQSKVGYFELAHRGTIFLDEIGDISPSTQVRLLRVLQEKEVQPVGATRSRKIDVRVIAATNRDLEQMVRDGSFREDLYYRLNVFPILVPPLRDRPEDIPVLVNRFVERFNRQMNRTIRSVDARALTLLCQYRWPGNVRELEHVIERAMILADGNRLSREQLPREIISPDTDSIYKSGAVSVGPLKAQTHDFKRRLIAATLKQCAGNRAQAAKILQIERRHLYTLMEQLNVEES